MDKQLNLAPESMFDRTELLCPRCGYNYLHHEKVHLYARSEDRETELFSFDAYTGQPTEHGLCDPDENPSARRHAVTVEFSCEGCKGPVFLHLAQHKGVTEIMMTCPPAEEEEEEEEEEDLGSSHIGLGVCRHCDRVVGCDVQFEGFPPTPVVTSSNWKLPGCQNPKCGDKFPTEDSLLVIFPRDQLAAVRLALGGLT
jgi:hypothetical protein